MDVSSIEEAATTARAKLKAEDGSEIESLEFSGFDAAFLDDEFTIEEPTNDDNLEV